MGLRNFLNRRNLPAEGEPADTVVRAGPVKPEPLTPEQLADLEAARAELLHLAAEVGVKSLNACPRDGSRWQDDPKTIRTITAVLREAHFKEQSSAEDMGPLR